MSDDLWFAEAERCIKRGEACCQVGDWRGAYGAYGTAVEFGLKAIYLRNHQLKDMPADMRDAKTHDLTYMARQAGIQHEIDAMQGKLKRHWAVVRDWDQGRRYPNEPFNTKDGKDLRLALIGKQNGVWQWLRNLYQSN